MDQHDFSPTSTFWDHLIPRNINTPSDQNHDDIWGNNNNTSNNIFSPGRSSPLSTVALHPHNSGRPSQQRRPAIVAPSLPRRDTVNISDNSSSALPSQSYNHFPLPDFPLPEPSGSLHFGSEDHPFQLPSIDVLTQGFGSDPNRSDSRLSWDSVENSLFGADWWTEPQDYNSNNGYVDLTADTSPPAMPPTTRKRNATAEASRDASLNPSGSRKRIKIGDASPKREKVKVERMNFIDVDDDQGLARTLERQREAAIREQREQADRPLRLSTLQCIICMEPMTDITVTHCGGSTPIISMPPNSNANHEVIYQATSSATLASWKHSSPGKIKEKPAREPQSVRSAARESVGRRKGKKGVKTSGKSSRWRSNSPPRAA